MHLTRLISYSEYSGPVNRKTLEQILIAARNHNMQDEITGLLCYNEKYFLQVLEGARERLSQTFSEFARTTRIGTSPSYAASRCRSARSRTGGWRMSTMRTASPSCPSATPAHLSSGPT